MAKAKDGEVSEEEAAQIEHPDEEHSSDSDAGIGVKRVAEPEPKRRRRAKGSEKPEKPEKPGVPQEAQPKSAASGAKRKASQKADELSNGLKGAEACISALDTFHPMNFWQGSLKRKDIDKRLALAYQTQSSLEEFVETNADAQKLCESLMVKSQQVTDWLDALIPLWNQDMRLTRARNMDKEDMTKLIKVVPNDCMHAMLVDVGRHFWEDWPLIVHGTSLIHC